jgi:hypothetical protein
MRVRGDFGSYFRFENEFYGIRLVPSSAVFWRFFVPASDFLVGC